MNQSEQSRRALSVAELSQALGLGLNKAYELVNSGRIKAVREGGRIIVPVAEIDRYLDHNAAGTNQP
jgi:excisionase family DNA binding protein